MCIYIYICISKQFPGDVPIVETLMLPVFSNFRCPHSSSPVPFLMVDLFENGDFLLR